MIIMMIVLVISYVEQTIVVVFHTMMPVLTAVLIPLRKGKVFHFVSSSEIHSHSVLKTWVGRISDQKLNILYCSGINLSLKSKIFNQGFA